ncbi:hypothetical protein [Glaciimonas soli]|uniref:Uncharacterized protein n=1 Tax=Glaciimonas soli TaxID=2590999 RepID=A0A843YZB4_9BURK|nr:hypothetical protein [Glaciimonas soli]MQR02562.1 hypothetical protein [Glaciimonas soli]
MSSKAFIWPKEITADRKTLPDGSASYHLIHSDIIDLGRLLLTPVVGGGSMLTCEVFSVGTAAEIARRRAVIEPLGIKLSAILGGHA